MSGINLDLLKESEKDPFGVCRTGLGSNAIFCDGCCPKVLLSRGHALFLNNFKVYS